MKTVRSLTLCILCACSILTVKAQLSVKEAFSLVPFGNLPYLFSKTTQVQYVAIENPQNIMPDTLYNDFQGTDYFLAKSDPELSPSLLVKLKIPNSNWIMGVVAFGGAIDPQTTELIIVDEQWNIRSALIAEIMFSSIPSKQFRITKEGKVIITKLVPISTQSIKMYKFETLEAYRVDETYFVNAEGKFVKESEKKFETKTYTHAQLDSMDINLWDI